MSARDFAPYQPPPDERLTAQNASSSRGVASISSVPRSAPIQDKVTRVSIDSDLDPRYATESYQSSTPRTPQYSASGFGENKQSLQSAPVWQQQQQHSDPSSQRLNLQQGRPDHLSYSTAQGYNLSNLCFAAWAFPPFSSVLMLIIETENVSASVTRFTLLVLANLMHLLAPSTFKDLVRFHAYQSGLLGVVSTLTFWILRSWFGWYTFSVIVGMAFLGYFWVCGSSAASSAPTLARTPYLAYVGPMAEQWVGEE